MKKNNFVAIDLEFNTQREIIQIGACYGDVLSWGTPSMFSCFVSDTVHPVDDRITELTTITNEQLYYEGHSLKSAVGKLKAFMDYQSETMGPRFINALTWGGNDSLMLAEQALEFGVDLFFGSCVLDVKHPYRTWRLSQGEYPNGSLELACKRLGVPFQGTAHLAQWDAYNTLQAHRALIQKFKG